jgi:lipopolysaccharide export system ATP-binding protein
MRYTDDLTDDEQGLPSRQSKDDLPPISEQIIPPADDFEFEDTPRPATPKVVPASGVPPVVPEPQVIRYEGPEPVSRPAVPVAPAASAAQVAPPAPVSVPAQMPLPPEPAQAAESREAFDPGYSAVDPAGGEHLMSTHGLVKVYDGRAVVNGVDINVRPGEIVGLLGPNGAGKTTTFYMIVGLVPPNGGQVIFNGDEVTTEPMYKRARLGMGYLPQEESIFRKMTVEQNIMAVMETLDLSRSERQERTQHLMERFGIDHIAKNIALTCSGGEKRRLTIARSLVTQPNLLMLDEPFSGVDPIAVNEIQEIVKDLRRQGLAILITDHNVRETLEIVDRAYLIYEGQVLREGTQEFLINDPVSRELYLGDHFHM